MAEDKNKLKNEEQLQDEQLDEVAGAGLSLAERAKLLAEQLGRKDLNFK